MALPKFDGSEPLDIINYLGELKKKLNRNKIPEGEAFLLLPDFLTGDARADFEQSLDIGENDLEGIDSWPAAVQYFLQTYCTNDQLDNALDIYDNIRQSPTETEQSY